MGKVVGQLPGALFTMTQKGCDKPWHQSNSQVLPRGGIYLGPVNTIRTAATGANFSGLLGARGDECWNLRATSDNEDGKIDPVPSGCGENAPILRSRPCEWSRHALRTRPRLSEFSLATLLALIVLTGPSFQGAPSGASLIFGILGFLRDCLGGISEQADAVIPERCVPAARCHLRPSSGDDRRHPACGEACGESGATYLQGLNRALAAEGADSAIPQAGADLCA